VVRTVNPKILKDMIASASDEEESQPLQALLEKIEKEKIAKKKREEGGKKK